MIDYDVIRTRLLEEVDKSYNGLAWIVRLIAKPMYHHIREQAKLLIKSAELIDGGDFDLSFNHMDYKEKTGVIRSFRNKSGRKMSISSACDCHKYYCGLDDILWESKRSSLFPEVFDKVSNLYKSRVVVIQQLHVMGNSYKEAIDGQIEMNEELFNYLRNNNLMSRIVVGQYRKASSRAMEGLSKADFNA